MSSSDDDGSDSDSGSSSLSDNDNEESQPRKKPRTEQKEDSGIPAPLEIAPSTASQNRGGLEELGNPKTKSNKLIILLDQARLETIKNRRGQYELLNCDDHRDVCKKKLRKDPKDFRPDICHQELLALLDSPLNKAGFLQVYIKTCNNVLIELHPSVRVPRTYKRFAGLMVQLLHKMKIKAVGGSTTPNGGVGGGGTTLMKVIKNPFSQHLPVGTRVYGMSCQGRLYSPWGLAKALVPLDPNGAVSSDAANASPSTMPVCFVIGAMATGHVTIEDHPYIEHMISISEYPLSGAAAINRILGAIEHQWGIV